MIAEAWNFLARQLACLEHGGTSGDFDFDTVDFEFRHSRAPWIG